MARRRRKGSLAGARVPLLPNAEAPRLGRPGAAKDLLERLGVSDRAGRRPARRMARFDRQDQARSGGRRARAACTQRAFPRVASAARLSRGRSCAGPRTPAEIPRATQAGDRRVRLSVRASGGGRSASAQAGDGRDDGASQLSYSPRGSGGRSRRRRRRVVPARCPRKSALSTLNGLTAVVTGGTAGIGRACAEALLAAGASAGLANGRERGRAERARVEIQSRFPAARIAIATGDVAQPEAACAVMAEAMKAFGRIDVLVNSSGGHDIPRLVHETTPEEMPGILERCLFGQIMSSRAALPYMREAKRGAIINMA